MFIRKHTVKTGGKKVAVKRQGQKVVLTLLGLYITQYTLNVSIDCVLPSAWLLRRVFNIWFTQIDRVDSLLKIIKFIKIIMFYHSAGKHDRGPLFFTLFSFRLISSRSTGSI